MTNFASSHFHELQYTEWFEGFPYLMQLWQAILIIPASTIGCEIGFLNLNK